MAYFVSRVSNRNQKGTFSLPRRSESSIKSSDYNSISSHLQKTNIFNHQPSTNNFSKIIISSRNRLHFSTFSFLSSSSSLIIRKPSIISHHYFFSGFSSSSFASSPTTFILFYFFCSI